MDRMDCISPIDARYYGDDPELFKMIQPVLSEEAQIKTQLKVELVLIEQLEESGIAPKGATQDIRGAIEEITPYHIYKKEQEIQHNIRAIVQCIKERSSDPDIARYVHLFATSNDITDTAKACLLQVAVGIVIQSLRDLIKHLSCMAMDNINLVQIGRTHGQHAEPITVGYWLACYVDRIEGRLRELYRVSFRGKMSGCVGAHNALKMHFDDIQADKFEDDFLTKMNLDSDRTSTQIVHPESVTDLGHMLISILSILADLSDDFRHLMRSEIGEVTKKVDEYHVGSSTMPHKVNPKDFENIKSIWKAMVPRMTTLYMDQLSEHQRDLTNSASSRFMGEIIFAVVYSCRKLQKALGQVEFNKKAIQKNMRHASHDIVAEPLYIAFALSGKNDPYEMVKTIIKRAQRSNKSLLDYLKEKPQEMKGIDSKHITTILNPDLYIGNAILKTRQICEQHVDQNR